MSINNPDAYEIKSPLLDKSVDEKSELLRFSNQSEAIKNVKGGQIAAIFKKVGKEMGSQMKNGKPAVEDVSKYALTRNANILSYSLKKKKLGLWSIQA
jgi:hypothetical protein